MTLVLEGAWIAFELVEPLPEHVVLHGLSAQAADVVLDAVERHTRFGANRAQQRGAGGELVEGDAGRVRREAEFAPHEPVVERQRVAIDDCARRCADGRAKPVGRCLLPGLGDASCGREGDT